MRTEYSLKNMTICVMLLLRTKQKLFLPTDSKLIIQIACHIISIVPSLHFGNGNKYIKKIKRLSQAVMSLDSDLCNI